MHVSARGRPVAPIRERHGGRQTMGLSAMIQATGARPGGLSGRPQRAGTPHHAHGYPGDSGYLAHFLSPRGTTSTYSMG